jgi:hypothetical protein
VFPAWRLRYPCASDGDTGAIIREDAMTPPRQEPEELRRALDAGAMRELPPNQVPGWVGERGPDMRKIDDFDKPGLNSGISQEVDGPVVFLAVVIALVVFFPAAYVILWRSRAFSRRYKIIATVVISVVLAAAGAWIFRTFR